MAPVALSEKAPVDFDKGRQRVTVGKFWCWLLSSLRIFVVLHFLSFASFPSATVVTVSLNFDTALGFVCHSCFAGAEHRKHVTGAAAREQWFCFLLVSFIFCLCCWWSLLLLILFLAAEWQFVVPLVLCLASTRLGKTVTPTVGIANPARGAL